MPWGRLAAAWGGLCLAVALVFGQTAGFDFVDLDDGEYVYDNVHVRPGLTLAGIRWALVDGHFDWYPLSTLSHMLDCQLFGLDPAGHHAMNVLLHAAASAALLVMLFGLTGRFWPSLLVSALFAVHPLRAESVAWIAERKDVLSGLLFMLTVAAYAHYARRPFSLRRYLAVAALFALGLMSKAMLVTLPAVLLLLDYWPLGRIGWPATFAGWLRPWRLLPARVLWEKLPLVALSAGVCCITLWTQRSASPMIDRVALADRCARAAVWCVTYVGQFFCLADLSPLNIVPHEPLAGWKVLAALALLLGVTALGLRWARSRPYLLVGWLWYLVMLLPVSGLVQVGSHGMADRYTYLPEIGLAVALAWELAGLAERWTSGTTGVSARPRWPVWAGGIPAALLLAALMGLAWRQTSYWRNSETLWDHNLATTPDRAATHANIAQILAARGRFGLAATHYQQALALRPDDAAAENNFATLLGAQGQIDEAVVHYRRALDIRPDFAGAQYNLGLALIGQGDPYEAAQHLERAFELQPRFAETPFNLGLIAVRQGKLNEAIDYFSRTLAIDPRHAEAHYRLAEVLAWQGNVGAAITHCRQALASNPQHMRADERLAALLSGNRRR